MSQVLPSARAFSGTGTRFPMPAAVQLHGPDASRVARVIERLFELPRHADSRRFDVRWRSATPYPALGEDESSRLQVDARGVSIDAPTIWGVLHALASLAGLVTTEGVNGCVIEDAPRFPWRGLMLDPARRFLPVGTLQTVIDGMALLKLNVLHLHLSDDQGFRFASTRYPGLASSAHYTQPELESLVEFAADRGVRLIPEIDMPGHVTSWLTAYPEWGAGQARATTRFGVHPACLNPADESVYDAIAAILDELCAIFPDEYVHIGGDEVHAAWWRDHPGVRSFMAAEGIADAPTLQARFNRRIAALLAARGRKVVGWDEVLHADMPAGVTVQSWRGATARDRALDAGCDCVVSSGFYLDLFYPGDVHLQYDPALPEAELVRQEDALLTDPRFAHVADGMRWTHAWRAVPHPKPSQSRGRILGGEACLWGELVDDGCIAGRVWSRLPDIAECLWAQAPETDAAALRERWPAFVHARLAEQRSLLASCVGSDTALEGLELCEPVKWYARLLGEAALRARIEGAEMPQARPYTTDTRLDRPVDYLLPESLTVAAVRELPADVLSDACARWARLEGTNEGPEEIRAVLAAVARGARVFLDCLAGDLSREEARAMLLALHRPYGEYMPAIVLVLAERLA